jgi:hypothetical protein
MGRRLTLTGALLVAVLASALTLSPAARAGVYRVYTCQAPGGVFLAQPFSVRISQRVGPTRLQARTSPPASMISARSMAPFGWTCIR